MRINYICVILAILFFIPNRARPSADDIALPDGFKIEEYAGGLDNPRFMAISPDGVLFTADMGDGAVIALPDKNGDGKADSVNKFISGLKRPNSIAFHGGYIYVGETDRVVRFKYEGADMPHGKKEVLISGLPKKGHFTKTLGFGPDGKMYVSMGSSCNICVEEDKRRATVMRYNPDGTGEEIYASGLRNSVGLTWHPKTGELWATDNGRDWLGDNLPPDEVNIVKEGKNYGWPYCYGDKIPDPDFDDAKKCADTVAPVVELQAHSAPLGLTFYEGAMFPPDYKGDLFVAYHGSWNRTVPTGYKVVRVIMKEGKPLEIQDFTSGWLEGNKRSGRPVDVLVGNQGEVYISDDFTGSVYRVTYDNKH